MRLNVSLILNQMSAFRETAGCSLTPRTQGNPKKIARPPSPRHPKA